MKHTGPEMKWTLPKSAPDASTWHRLPAILTAVFTLILLGALGYALTHTPALTDKGLLNMEYDTPNLLFGAWMMNLVIWLYVTLFVPPTHQGLGSRWIWIVHCLLAAILLFGYGTNAYAHGFGGVAVYGALIGLIPQKLHAAHPKLRTRMHLLFLSAIVAIILTAAIVG